LPAISGVTVKYTGDVLPQHILPILTAKAKFPNVQWDIRVYNGSGNHDSETMLVKMISQPSGRLLGDVKSGVFTEISMRRVHEEQATWDDRGWCKWEWRIVLRKKRGGRNGQEKDNMAVYCAEFAECTKHFPNERQGPHQETVVKIEVKNGDDVLVEKYFWSTNKRDLAVVVGKAKKEKKRGIVAGTDWVSNTTRYFEHMYRANCNDDL
jgi:hypothetical protein